MTPVQTLRDVIRTKSVAPILSDRNIAKICKCSPATVGRVLKRAKKLAMDLPTSLLLRDNELKDALYPDIRDESCNKRRPDYEVAHKELLKRKGKSRTVLYLEYRAIDPNTAYSKSHYFMLLRTFLKVRRIAMRQQHQAGDVVYIDYAGTVVYYQDEGATIAVKVFVGCLGASKKLFAWATVGERTRDWVEGMTRMFSYFGGVTQVISIDNATALVAKPGLLPVLNDNIRRFAVHYNCIVDSCRVGTPQDKSLAELGVKHITQRILRPMNSNKMVFTSLVELNDYLSSEVEKLNNERFQKMETTRNKLFDEVEAPVLLPLPANPFALVHSYRKVKVPVDYHIIHNQHAYSVPHTLANKYVEVREINEKLIIDFNNRTVAKHDISLKLGGETTCFEHLSPAHQAESLKTKEEYLKWACTVGVATEQYIEWLYTRTSNVNSRAIGKQCAHLIKVCEKLGEAEFNFACKYALRLKLSAFDIDLAISSMGQMDELTPPPNVGNQRFIRGKNAFLGGRHAH